MWNMLWPILIVVGANTAYNIAAKSTPSQVNAFASLAVSYLVAAVSAIVMFFVTSGQKNIFAEVAKTNWTAYALGIAIVGLEFGFLCVYRAGWKISTAQLFASIALSCVLLDVYKRQCVDCLAVFRRHMPKGIFDDDRGIHPYTKLQE